MSIKYNRVDMALISSGSTEIIDISETGGIESCHLIAELEDGGSVTVNGSATAEGTFAAAFTITVPSDGVYRGRLPIDAPRFLACATEGATISIRA